MTNQELQELSQRVAYKFKVDVICNFGDCDIWLHQDLERVMRLAIEHEIDINYSNFQRVSAMKRYLLVNTENYKDHDTREHAVIVAVMKALLEVEV